MSYFHSLCVRVFVSSKLGTNDESKVAVKCEFTLGDYGAGAATDSKDPETTNNVAGPVKIEQSGENDNSS